MASLPPLTEKRWQREFYFYLKELYRQKDQLSLQDKRLRKLLFGLFQQLAPELEIGEEEISWEKIAELLQKLAPSFTEEEIATAAVPTNLSELLQQAEEQLLLQQQIKEAVAEMMRQYGLEKETAKELTWKIIQQQQAAWAKILEEKIAQLSLPPADSAKMLEEIGRRLPPLVVREAVVADKEEASAVKKATRRVRKLLSSGVWLRQALPQQAVLRKLPPAARKVILRELKEEWPQQVVHARIEKNLLVMEESLADLPPGSPPKRLLSLQLAQAVGEIKIAKIDKTSAELLATVVAQRLERIWPSSKLAETKTLLYRWLGFVPQLEEVPKKSSFRQALLRFSVADQQVKKVVSQKLEEEISRLWQSEGREIARQKARLWLMLQPKVSFYQEGVSRKELPKELSSRLPPEWQQKDVFSYWELVSKFPQLVEQSSLTDEQGNLTWWGRLLARQWQSLPVSWQKEILQQLEKFPSFPRREFWWQLGRQLPRFTSPSRFGQFLGRSFSGIQRGVGKIFSSWSSKTGERLFVLGKSLLARLTSWGGKLLPAVSQVGVKILTGLTTTAVGLPAWVGVVIVVVLVLLVLLGVLTLGSSTWEAGIQERGSREGEIAAVARDLTAVGDHLAARVQRAFEECGVVPGKPRVERGVTAVVLAEKSRCLINQGISPTVIRKLKKSAHDFGVLQCVGFVKATVKGFPGGADAYHFVDSPPEGWRKVLAREEVKEGDLVVWGPSSRCHGGSCDNNPSCCGHIGVITRVEKPEFGVNYLYVTQAWGNSGKVSTIKVHLDSPDAILKRE